MSFIEMWFFLAMTANGIPVHTGPFKTETDCKAAMHVATTQPHDITMPRMFVVLPCWRGQ